MEEEPMMVMVRFTAKLAWTDAEPEVDDLHHVQPVDDLRLFQVTEELHLLLLVEDPRPPCLLLSSSIKITTDDEVDLRRGRRRRQSARRFADRDVPSPFCPVGEAAIDLG